MSASFPIRTIPEFISDIEWELSFYQQDEVDNFFSMISELKVRIEIRKQLVSNDD